MRAFPKVVINGNAEPDLALAHATTAQLQAGLDQLSYASRLPTSAADGFVSADPSLKRTVGTVRLPSLT